MALQVEHRRPMAGWTTGYAVIDWPFCLCDMCLLAQQLLMGQRYKIIIALRCRNALQVKFFRERRLKPQLKMANDSEMSRLGEVLCRNLESLFEGIEARFALRLLRASACDPECRQKF